MCHDEDVYVPPLMLRLGFNARGSIVETWSPSFTDRILFGCVGSIVEKWSPEFWDGTIDGILFGFEFMN